ncbi:MAG: hypothetical protein AAFR61_17205 [Bacteroidota bacterium]
MVTGWKPVLRGGRCSRSLQLLHGIRPAGSQCYGPSSWVVIGWKPVLREPCCSRSLQLRHGIRPAGSQYYGPSSWDMTDWKPVLRGPAVAAVCNCGMRYDRLEASVTDVRPG